MNRLNKELVLEWLSKAEGDFEVAKTLKRSKKKKKFLYAIVFHYQQSIEKHLKALLLCHKIDFPKTHDFEKLLALIKIKDPYLLNLQRDFMRLNPYAVELRYPSEDVTAKELIEVAKISKKLRVVLKKRIKEFI